MDPEEYRAFLAVESWSPDIEHLAVFAHLLVLEFESEIIVAWSAPLHVLILHGLSTPYLALESVGVCSWRCRWHEAVGVSIWHSAEGHDLAVLKTLYRTIDCLSDSVRAGG